MRKTVIFDLDDTLIRHDRLDETKYLSEYLDISDTNRFSAAFYESLSNIKTIFLGRKVTREKIASYFEETIPALRENNIKGETLIEAMEESSINIRDKSVDRTLHHLQVAGIRMFVLTNWFYSSQANVLKNFGYLDYFSRIFSWDDWYAKPDKRAILRCIGANNPKDFILVGDSLYDDVLCAKMAGVTSVWFNPNHNSNISKIHPDYVISDMLDLLDITI